MRISDWSSDVCSSDLEAYFSNFIEGTRFDVQEARQIIETGRPMPARDEDSHDVLGTYQIVGNRQEMASIPQERSEERREGKECVSTCRYRWSPSHSQKKNKK